MDREPNLPSQELPPEEKARRYDQIQRIVERFRGVDREWGGGFDDGFYPFERIAEVVSGRSGEETPIEALSLSDGSFNPLWQSGIRTVGDILGATEDGLLGIRNFGGGQLEEVRIALLDRGIIGAEAQEKE